MKRKLTAMFTALLLSLALLGSAVAAPYYSDTGHLAPWASESVDFVTKYGLMNGVSGGKFDPDGYADRAMVATLIWRLAGRPIGNLTGVFADVPLEQWYSDAIDWAAEEEIVTGAYGRFNPFDDVTRQDLVLILYRYAGSPVSDVTVLSYYKDFTQVSGYAANAMAWAVQNGILTGTKGSLLPKESATRAQLAAILTRYLKLNPDQLPEQVLPDPDPEPTDPENPDLVVPEGGGTEGGAPLSPDADLSPEEGAVSADSVSGAQASGTQAKE